MAVPFPATPFFHDRLARGLILPDTKVRDLEGSTLTLRPLDPIEDVARFIATPRTSGATRSATSGGTRGPSGAIAGHSPPPKSRCRL